MYIQSLRSYFSESEFTLMNPHPFKFAPVPTLSNGMWGEDGDEWEPELEIRFPRILPESGWKLVLESERKV